MRELPKDCGVCVVCGDGTCAEGETCDSCPDDCNVFHCPECGDGICSWDSSDILAKENCANCPQDCGVCLGCGNGSCGAGKIVAPGSTAAHDKAYTEDCAACVHDCGLCEACGDGTCDPGEHCQNCAADCGACPDCGDGDCDTPLEVCEICPEDCGPCPFCGDGQLDFPKELCEAGDTTVCAALGKVGEGDVPCGPDCQWDDSGCTACTTDTPGCPGGPACNEGPCCDLESGELKPWKTACGDGPVDKQWGCDGDKVQVREAVWGCPGNSTECLPSNGNYAWQAWQTIETCAGANTCAASAGFAQCVPADCDGGACCTASKSFAPKTTQCGDALVATETQCAGATIVERSAFAGCPGSSATCSADAADRYWTDWTTVTTCAGNSVCEDTEAGPACVGDGECDSGACCDSATKALFPAGAACAGSSVVFTQRRCVGDVLEKREARPGCSGSGAACSPWEGHWAWSDWTVETTCKPGHCMPWDPVSNATGGGVHYATAGCAEGYESFAAIAACYDGVGGTAKPLPVGTKCSDEAAFTQTRCVNGDIKTWQSFPGCQYDGTNMSCTGGHKGPYIATEACGPNGFCFEWTNPTTGVQTKCMSENVQQSCTGFGGAPIGGPCGTEVQKWLFTCDNPSNAIVGIRRLAFCKDGVCPEPSVSCDEFNACLGPGGDGYDWTPAWETVQKCPEGTLCEVCGVDVSGLAPHPPGFVDDLLTQNLPTCVPIGSDYTLAGVCRDCATGTDEPAGTLCYAKPDKWQFRCSTSNAIERRKGTSTCDGAGQCSSATNDVAWGPWEFYKQCVGNNECTENGPLSVYCKFIPDLKPCGDPCAADGDCQSGSCQGGLCKPASCQSCAGDETCDFNDDCKFLTCAPTGAGGNTVGPFSGSPPPKNGCFDLSGEMSRGAHTAGAFALSSARVVYDLDTLIGEPWFFITYEYTSADAATLPPGTRVFVKLEALNQVKYAQSDPAVPPSGGGLGYNTVSSPSWATALCDAAWPKTGCLSDPDAKAFWAAGPCVTGFVILPQ